MALRPDREGRYRPSHRDTCCPRGCRSGTRRKTSRLRFSPSGLLSYSWTNNVTTPPGLRWALATSKNSLRVKRGRALDPRIERVRCDGVELLLRREQIMPRVVDLHVDLRIPITLTLAEPKYFEATRGTSGSISAIVTRSTRGSMLTAPAVTPAPQPITSTARGRSGTSVVRWPSIRCSRMSCGSLDA